MARTRTTKAEMIAAQIEAVGCPLPLVVSHYLSIGERAAATINNERIAQEVAKQRQEEETAAKRGMVCLLSADFVGAILKGCEILATQDQSTRYKIIKMYLK